MWRRSAPVDGHEISCTSPSQPSNARLRAAAFAAVLALPLAAWLLRGWGAIALGNAASIGLVAIALTALVRTFGVRVRRLHGMKPLALVAAAAAFGLAPVYWPPVAVNFAMAAVFGVTLWRGEPLVTRFARLEGAPVTPRIERYCRRLTAVWTLYLALLGCVGIAIAVHGDERIGAWWCAIVNYLLVLALFLGERLLRPIRAQASVREQARNVLTVLRGGA